MEPALLLREDEKYSHLWANGYKSARWRILAGRLARRADAFGQKPKVVDFGFGKGDALAWFRKRGYAVAGVDISTYAVDRMAAAGYEVYRYSLDALEGFADDRFDIGFSNDVLEHLPEESVEGALSEMRRTCARYLFLSVCPTPSRNRSKEGEGLHLTVRPKAWWEARLRDLGEVREIRILLNRSLRYEVRLEKPFQAAEERGVNFPFGGAS